MKAVDFDKMNNILIRSTNWIGDVIMTTPAVTTIRKNFPHARISILAKPWVIPVLRYNPHIDNLLTYDENGRHKGIFGKLRLAKELRRQRYDAAILLQNAFEAAWVAFLAGIPCRIGYNTDGRGFLLTHPVPFHSALKKIHHTDYYLNMLKEVGLENTTRELCCVVGPNEKDRAKHILLDHGISNDDPLVGINPGATFGPAKQWPFERYAELINKIQKFSKSHILILGGPGEDELGEKISRITQKRPINLAGKTRLGEAMALIELCDLFITNDSGLMHVAAALDIPLIGIFGSTTYTTTGPLGVNSRAIQIPMDCNPCHKPECPEGHMECLDRISVDMVFDVVKEML